jgi:iron complex transport system permease protein
MPPATPVTPPVLPAQVGRSARRAPIAGLRSSRVAGLVGALGLLAAAAVASLAIGSRSVPLAEVVRSFTAYDGSDAHAIVRDLRVPRTLLGILVGGALGGAGALMQGATRNPLAEPGLLGINAGASFAVVLAIAVLGISSVAAYTPVALAGAAVTVVLVLVLGGGGRGVQSPLRFVIAGAVLMTLLVSCTSAVLVFDAETLDQFRFWAVGSLAGREAGVIAPVALVIAAGLVIALAAGRGLNALALGDDVARALGQRVGFTRLAVCVGFVLLAGGAVAAAGPIAFVGLAVPHVARAVVGSDYRWVIPYSILLGALLLLAADTVGRVLVRPAELEVGIVTGLIGAPFFVWLARRRSLATL